MSYIPLDDDRILKYVKPLLGKCQGRGCTAYIMNQEAYRKSNTYWCHCCSIYRKRFVMVNPKLFREDELPTIKKAVIEHLKKHRGYYVNIKY